MSVARRLLVWVSLAATLVAPAALGAPRKHPAKHARAARSTPPGYYAHVRRWHERPADAGAPSDASGRVKLVLEAINLGERVELEATSDQGEFSESERSRAAHLLRDGRRDGEHVVDSALLDLLYRLQRHFDAPCIRVISAFRTPRGAATSQHGRGRAADIVIPGVEDRVLAAYARSLAGTGVGLYPVSGFVHVDVRERNHYWVDSSGPGQRSRVVGKKKSRPPPKKRKGAARAKHPAEG